MFDYNYNSKLLLNIGKIRDTTKICDLKFNDLNIYLNPNNQLSSHFFYQLFGYAI